MRIENCNVHRSQLARKVFLSLTLFVFFIICFALMTLLALSLVETDEESRAPKEALTIVFGIAMYALMVAFGFISQLSNTGSIDSEIISE